MPAKSTRKGAVEHVSFVSVSKYLYSSIWKYNEESAETSSFQQHYSCLVSLLSPKHICAIQPSLVCLIHGFLFLMCASSGYAILGVLTEVQHNASSSSPLNIQRSLRFSILFIYQYILSQTTLLKVLTASSALLGGGGAAFLLASNRSFFNSKGFTHGLRT